MVKLPFMIEKEIDKPLFTPPSVHNSIDWWSKDTGLIHFLREYLKTLSVLIEHNNIPGR